MENQEKISTKKKTTASPPVVKITALDYAFQAPDTIASGWVTFEMTNSSKESHYFQLNPLRLPEGRTFADYQETYLEPADSLALLVDSGKADSKKLGQMLNRIVPAWTKRVLGEDKGGGMPLVAPGRTASSIQKIDPGTYLMSCFAMRSPEGLRHIALGMRHKITVVKDSTTTSHPKADFMMHASGHEITIDGQFRAGRQIGAYHVKKASQQMDDYYWSAMLARIKKDEDVNKLKKWINEGSYRNPVLVDYIRGFEYLSPGDTAFAELNLEPGRYAWHVHGQQDTMWTFSVE